MSETDPVTAVVQTLDELGVEHRLVRIDPADADTAVFCEKHQLPLEDAANALLVMSRKGPERYAACVVLATTRVDVNGVARKRLGARKASFAPAETMERLTGMKVGGMTPFGLPAEVPIWIDAAVMERDEVVVGAGGRDAKVFLAPRELLKVPGTEVVEGLAKAPPPRD